MARELPCPGCDAILRGQDAAAERCPRCGDALRVLGAYRLSRRLSGGATALVYAAWGGDEADEVAVHLFAPAGSAEGFAPSFEARCARWKDLRHPGLPVLHAYGRDERGRAIVVRELFRGGTLEERVETADVRLGAVDVRSLAIELLQIFDFLERQDPPVTHGDPKPSNVFFRTDGDWRPVLVDFDCLAAMAPGGELPSGRGSPGYAAPEEASQGASTRTDLYGAGACLLFVATHVSPDRLTRVQGRFDVERNAAWLRRSLRHVIAQLVEPEPERRYQSAEEALRILGVDETGPVGPGARGSRTARPRHLVALLAALAVTILAAVAFVVLRGAGDGSSDGAEASPAERAPIARGAHAPPDEKEKVASVEALAPPEAPRGGALSGLDLRRVDAAVVLERVGEAVARVAPRARLVGIEVDGATAGMADLTVNAQAIVYFYEAPSGESGGELRLEARVTREGIAVARLAERRRRGDAGASHDRAALPAPRCTVAGAFRTAISTGVPADVKTDVRYYADERGAVWGLRVEGHDELRREVDAESCALRRHWSR